MLNKKIKTLIVASMMTLAMTISAFAATSSQLESSATAAVNAGAGTSAVLTIITNNCVTDQSQLTVEGSDKIISFEFNGVKYYLLASESNDLKTELDEAAESSENIIASQKSDAQSASEKLHTGLSNFDIEADLDKATIALSGFKDIISLLMGIGATVAILGLGLFTACDVCYLSIPVLHSKMDSAGSGGGKMASQSKEGGTKFALITDDAVFAYNKANEEQKQPWGLYLKRRSITFFMMAIVIYILMTGQITILVDLALNLTSGIIDQLVDLATFS